MTNTLRNFAQKIREINQRYSKPHIEMSRGVKIALLSLRVYLLLLVSLMAYKFITLLS
jgi:hypothetical protein